MGRSNRIWLTGSDQVRSDRFREFIAAARHGNTVAKLALESVGNFSVAMCGSGDEALGELPNYNPDIILLDVMMPGMDGLDTLKAIRQLDGYENVPIIFMTAKVMEKDRDHYRSLGAAGVIAKPFDPMNLADQVRKIWGEYHGG